MSETFNKEDYLSASEYATKHGITKEIVDQAIKELTGVTFKKSNLIRKSIIVKTGTRRSVPKISPESEAQEIFAKKIEQIQNRGK